MELIERGSVKGKGGRRQVRIEVLFSEAEDRMVKKLAREAGLTVPGCIEMLIRKYAGATLKEGNKR
jgi:hypothetical protein